MFQDWIAREGWMIVSWWLIATAAGAAALPLCLRLLNNLPDKGYTLARAAGILLTAFVYWLLSTLGLLRNEPGNIMLAWLLVLLIGVGAFRQVTRPSAERQPFDWRGYWRDNRWTIIAAEVLFLALFIAWTVVRTYQNNLNGTEKPMDLAFLSASMYSASYPPNDPWLSGFAISYYYFGYVIAAMFANLSGVVSTVAYNLWTAMLFALTGLTAFGVVSNLVRARYVKPDEDEGDYSQNSGVMAGILTGLFGVILLLLAGNYQAAFVEIPYQSRAATASYLQFWDVNMRQEPLTPFAPCPADQPDCPRPDWSIDFFRAARTLNDRNLPSMVDAGEPERIEVINEFPMFSFILADNHPHVMALPFTLLALGLAVNTLLGTRGPTREQTLLYGICLGALIFLNTWDSPVYILVLVSADTLRRLLATGRLTVDDWLDSFILLLLLLAIAVVAYFPFLVSFSSQLGGVLPNLIHPTLFQQYFLAFGPVLPVALLFLLVEAWRGLSAGRFHIGFGLQTVLAFFLLMVLGMLILILLISQNEEARITALSFIDTAGGWSAFLPQMLTKRATHILTTLVLLFLIFLVVARLYIPTPAEKNTDSEAKAKPRPYSLSTGFALLIIGAAAALTLLPDYLFLRDNFGSRMNTVFKFYYIGWTLFAVGGAYGVYSIFADVRLRLPALPVRAVLAGITSVALALGLVYTVMGIYIRAGREASIITAPDTEDVDGDGLTDETIQFITLDGWRSLVYQDDYNAITCVKALVGDEQAVVLEAASNGSYDFYLPSSPMGSGRVSDLTGLPTVLGWNGHQSQWRGRGHGAAVGSRAGDVPRIYEALQIDQVSNLITRYEIDYILFGAVERERYGSAGEQKFLEAYDVVCESNSSRVFRVRDLNTVADSTR